MKVVKINNAKYLEEYKLLLTFNDETSKIVDFKDLLKSTPYTNEKKFSNMEFFKLFWVEVGDLIWSDYDMCFQAKNLYQGILRKS